MFGIVIDKTTGYVNDMMVEVLEDGTLVGYELQEHEQVIPFLDNNPVGGMGKPRYDFTNNLFEDEGVVEPTTPDKNTILEARIDDLERTNANLLLEIAAIKGGV